MNWFFIALIPPILDATVNHIDKHLLSRYLKGGSAGSFVLFSVLLTIVILPFVAILNWQEVLAIGVLDRILLAVNGAVLVLATIFYFYAMNEHEASVVAPFFQLVPVLTFALAYFVLEETLTFHELAGSLVVILGALVLSLNLVGKGVRIKQKLVFFMLVSSLFFAVNGVLFKYVTESAQAFWPSLFWDLVGKIIIGVFIFLFIKSYRNQFLVMLKENKAPTLLFSGLNEVLVLISQVVLLWVVLLAPVTLVQVLGGVQPVFVFLIGVLITKFLPSFSQESLSRRDLVQKVVGIVIVVIGAVIVNS